VVHLADGQQQHRRPVDAEEVVIGEPGARRRRVDPFVTAEPDPRAQLVVDARVPVDRHAARRPLPVVPDRQHNRQSDVEITFFDVSSRDKLIQAYLSDCP